MNLPFLKKLSRQKPFWDEARLSTIIKKKCLPPGCPMTMARLMSGSCKKNKKKACPYFTQLCLFCSIQFVIAIMANIALPNFHIADMNWARTTRKLH